jgi:hypothetical protein
MGTTVLADGITMGTTVLADGITMRCTLLSILNIPVQAIQNMSRLGTKKGHMAVTVKSAVSMTTRDMSVSSNSSLKTNSPYLPAYLLHNPITVARVRSSTLHTNKQNHRARSREFLQLCLD